MITCKEFKEVLYEVCFASVKFAAKINNIAENVEAPEVVNFKKEARPSMASQHISYDDDVFYLTNGIGYLADLERRSPIPLASIKRVMIPHKIYNEIISVDSEPYDVILQALTGLGQIILLHFPKHTFPSHYMNSPDKEPARGYEARELLA
ncbi:hypothetical protein ONS95_012135 [Cadophora gregata]|uniref:uncharacterized protein n=1 Tax=Cadophora gregata TaxID=51156 RepID=UPI0026DB5BCD|nr:uncharacterized protein ONS95_012135 [Cadophora gregata]KAK0117811.1 hypothetical protein ONS95_012135 [Cadophora gregata]